MRVECPYCGGDISKCDFESFTDRCSEMERRLADKGFPTDADIERSQRWMSVILGDAQ
jgi:hypothetical protein